MKPELKELLNLLRQKDFKTFNKTLPSKINKLDIDDFNTIQNCLEAF